ncbi:MAG: insulinase family protein [Dysgonamonadaceae bacterium]|jgi:predicted Zn-dependent peptidase|nr:insulinase family protein [Dysgonamonadaceae bacterium]
MQYFSFRLANGLRIVHLPSDSIVSYCGFAVNAGARDEKPTQHGMAHFVEHMLFKGTRKRKAWHILNRMENVGGELNAYTTKEETFIYSVCLSQDVERAIELLSDLVGHSQFPAQEIEKEREVVIDEIHSYEDTPSELIFDEFENLVFSGNELGHHILGDTKSLAKFTSAACASFVNRFYSPEQLVFFSYGKTPFAKIVRLAEKYMLDFHYPGLSSQRTAPVFLPSQQVIVNKKNLHQTHVVIGAEAYCIFNNKRIGLCLLNNILGGQGMNSRLNLSLREKYGLVYTVESGLGTYTDTGIFTIYFACDHESKDKCLQLVHKELKRLRDNKLSGSQFAAAVKQWKGQLGIAGDSKENTALRMGKSFLHFNKYDELPQVYQKIDALTAEQLVEIANEIYEEKNLFSLIYQ